MKVSFVIPVYKVEKYLDECVQSILKQTYRDYEILLVDDGSPDLCPEMCDHWARVDDRIRHCINRMAVFRMLVTMAFGMPWAST